MNARTLGVIGLAASLALCGCNTVKETGRSQIAWMPEGMMNSLGASAYAEETGRFPEITSGAQAQMLQRVGERIAKASGRNYQWEFKLLDAPEVPNAFCLPGGKIAVYTGILPITKNEDGLAAVIGHEVAHATSHHGNERMTQGFVAQLGLAAAQVAVEGFTDADDATKAEIMGALGMASQFGAILPFSRKHESEADEIGLRFLVRAGYDPNEAPRLWERMARAFPNDTPEFMSTHPDPLARAARLRDLIPKIVAEETGQ